MKKTFILLATIFSISATTQAQTIFDKSNTTVIKNNKSNHSKKINKSFDLSTYNRGKDANSFGSFEQTTSDFVKKGAEVNELKPFGNINAQRWTYGTNVDTDETIMFSIDAK